MDLDLAFWRPDTIILYKRHITHENKAVSCKNHRLKAFNLGCRSFILKKKKMEKIAVWPISVYTASDGL